MRLLPAIAALFIAASTGLSAADDTAKQVGVVWNTTSSKVDATFATFAKTLGEKAPSIQLEVKGKLKSMAEVGKYIDEWQTTKHAVVVLRSQCASYLVDHAPKIPTFTGVTNDPVELGIIKDPKAPEGLITGTTYAIPAAAQVGAMQRLVPGLKAIGLLLMEGHPGAAIDRAGTEAACKAAGLGCEVRLVKSKDALAVATKELKDAGVGMIALGTQNLVFDNAATVAQIAGALPIYSFSEKPIQTKHALAGLVADDGWLGERLAEQVIAVLMQGKKTSELPVVYDPKPRLLLNKGKAAEQGIALSPEVLAGAQVIE